MVTFNPRKGPVYDRQITLRISEGTLEKIDQCACQYNVSRNDFIIQCIEFALDSLVSDDKANNEHEKRH